MVLKECCNTCGFPVDMPREPVFLVSNVFSVASYVENRCEGCGRQADGSTIASVTKLISKIVNERIVERKKLIDFFSKFHIMTTEQRLAVCVKLPRFCNPNYKSKRNDQEDDLEEPYSWNVMYDEVIRDTKLSRTMLNNLKFMEDE